MFSFTKFAKITLFILFCVAPIYVLAEENLEVQCQLNAIEQRCNAVGTIECKKLLEQCEQYYSQQSQKMAEDISKTQQEKNTLKNKISTLNKKIKELDYQISQNNLVIRDLQLQVEDTANSITKTIQKIEEEKARLANILRAIHAQDRKSSLEIVTADDKLSDFFSNLVSLEIMNVQNKELLANIKILKINLESQKESLDTEKEGLEKTVKLQQLQKQESASTKKSQEYYLSITEQEYQKQVQERAVIEKKAAEIRAKLFQMIGVAKAPTFGEALEVAKGVASITGIRPAFLLAVISQESAIGRNVGQCMLSNAVTGTGKRISTGAAVSNLMKPSRDVSPFLKITAALGRDPYNTPVSCPLSIGYGGAMGPAQFIPSTWMLYADKLLNVLGKAGDPWAIKDSFAAAALYLADLGAAAQTSAKESSAASRYYGGSSSYARQVMNRAACIQSFIDAGTMSVDCERLIF